MRIKRYTEVLPSGTHCFIYIDLDCIESVARYGRNPDQPNTIVLKSGRRIDVAEPVRQIVNDWEGPKRYQLTTTFKGGAFIKTTYDTFEEALSAQESVRATNADVETTITRQ